MKICDICKKEEKVRLVELRDIYKTKKVKEICLDCEKKLDRIVLNVASKYSEIRETEERENILKFIEDNKK